MNETESQLNSVTISQDNTGQTLFVNGQKVLFVARPTPAKAQMKRIEAKLDSAKFTGPTLKIRRAEQHFNEIVKAWDTYFPAIQIYIDAQSDPDNIIYRAKVATPIPSELSTIIGDVVHNLRSSLDQLICDLVRRNNGVVTRDHAFPIQQSQPSFESRSRTALRGLTPRAEAFIRRLKPYQGGNDLLWMLSCLDNMDKHNTIVPVAIGRAAAQILLGVPGMFQAPSGEITIGGGPPGSIPLGHGYGWGTPESVNPAPMIEDNCEIYKEPRIIRQLNMPVEYDFAVELTIGATPSTRSAPATDILADLLIYAEKIIYLAEKHLY